MRLLARIPLLAWIFGAIAAAALVAWPLGGWGTVKVVSTEIPDFASGQVMHGNRFDLSIDGVELRTNDPSGYGPAPEGMIYLVVHTKVTNVWHESAGSGALEDSVVLDNHDLDGNLGPTEVLADDGTGSPELNPGLPRNIDIVYTVPRSAVQAGDRVHLDLYDAHSRAGFVLYGTQWDPFLVGTAVREVTV